LRHNGKEALGNTNQLVGGASFLRTKSSKNRLQTCGNKMAVFIDETQICILAVYTCKSKKKRIFETNDTLHSLLENDED